MVLRSTLENEQVMLHSERTSNNGSNELTASIGQWRQDLLPEDGGGTSRSANDKIFKGNQAERHNTTALHPHFLGLRP
jgi:hypothetical protein